MAVTHSPANATANQRHGQHGRQSRKIPTGYKHPLKGHRDSTRRGDRGGERHDEADGAKAAAGDIARSNGAKNHERSWRARGTLNSRPKSATAKSLQLTKCVEGALQMLFFE